MKAVRFTVSGALLRESLHIPETARIVDVARSFRNGWGSDEIDVEFVVTDDAIPEAAEIHVTDPTIKHTREAWTWDWNVPA